MTRMDSIKMAGCGVLAALAVVLAVTALGSIETRAQAAGGAGYASAETVYVLKDSDGYVAVFTPESKKKPATVTNIPTESLPLADRALLEQGISVYGWDELQKLLEDLGS